MDSRVHEEEWILTNEQQSGYRHADIKGTRDVIVRDKAFCWT